MNSTFNQTDLVVFIACLIFFWNGWRKGFLRTLLGPICLFIGSMAGMIYYQRDPNIINSLAISIVVPFLLMFLASSFIKLAQNQDKESAKDFVLGRVAGGFVSLLWCGGLLFLVIAMISLIPAKIPGLADMQDNLRHSKTVALINTLSGAQLKRGSEQIEKVAGIFKDADKVEKIRSSEKYVKVMSDNKIQDLFADQTTAKQIKDNDIFHLMSNPKMQAILKDNQLLKQLLELNQDIIKEGLSGQAGEKTAKEKKTVEPHVIEIKKSAPKP